MTRIHQQHLRLVNASIIIFVAVFTVKSIQIHQVFGTSAYDLGIFDQEIWLLSCFQDLFNTVRGMNSWGDHFCPIHILFVPLYWIVPSVNWLFLVQSLFVGIGAAAIFRIGLRMFPETTFAPLVFALLYLLNPVVHSTLLWQYHSAVLATGLYLFLIMFYLEGRLKPFVLTLLLVLSCREDIPFTLAALGVTALIQRKWIYAAILVGASVLWWVTITGYVMPLLNGTGYFRHESGTVQVVISNLFNFDYYIQRFVIEQDAVEYLLKVFVPLGFLSFLSPAYLIPAVPTLFVNIMIGGHNTDIGVHYSANVIPFVFVSAMFGARRLAWSRYGLLKKIPPSPCTALILVVLFFMTGHAALNHSSLNLHPEKIVSDYRAWQKAAERRAEVSYLKEHVINMQDGVAASDVILPHFSQRKKIFLLPNPWKLHYWGIQGENQRHPNEIKYIVIAKTEYRHYSDILTYLVKRDYFRLISTKGGLLVYKREKQEVVDRDLAVAEFVTSSPAYLKFTCLKISPDYERDKLFPPGMEVDPALELSNDEVGWISDRSAGTRLVDIDFLQWLSNGDYKAVLVYAEVESVEGGTASLVLGSDDGITVWLNGHRILHKPDILRPVNLGDELVTINLKTGKNIFYFRVVNATGAWRLMARIVALKIGP